MTRSSRVTRDGVLIFTLLWDCSVLGGMHMQRRWELPKVPDGISIHMCNFTATTLPSYDMPFYRKIYQPSLDRYARTVLVVICFLKIPGLYSLSLYNKNLSSGYFYSWLISLVDISIARVHNSLNRKSFVMHSPKWSRVACFRVWAVLLPPQQAGELC